MRRRGALDAACARSASARDGARRSSAQALRWFMTGTCASQQRTLQNANGERARLQVETLHTHYRAECWMGFLQEEQVRQVFMHPAYPTRSAA